MLQLVPHRAKPALPPSFRDLRVRPKLIVLHNTFFLVLTVAVYYSLIPLVEEHVQSVQQRESALLGELLLEQQRPLPLGDIQPEDRRFGSAAELDIPANILTWLDDNPGRARWDAANPGYLYLNDPVAGRYARLRLPEGFFAGVVRRAKITMFASLGLIYVLAVLALELIIMPRYVYQPIRATLAADNAAQEGDRDAELIAPQLIPGDEIGDIMRSRNATVAMLREKEDTLESALSRLGELAQDLRRKNEELAGARRGMAAQDRLATIGLLSASVAHEINTPLAVIRGSVDKLLESGDAPATEARLERVKRMAERLSRISERLLDFSRVRDAEERKPVAVRELLDEAWSLLAIDARAAGVVFSNDVDPRRRVLGDYDRLMQVFVNLLRNGMYAIDGTGAVRAHSALEHEDGKKWLSISIDDSGTGIPEDVLPNIFEAFVSTRLDSRGTGLGLTVADGIVQQHGGRISAANRPEGGARLTVLLPSM